MATTAKLIGLALARNLAGQIAKQLPGGSVTSAKPGAPRQQVRSNGVSSNVAAVWAQAKTVHVLLPLVTPKGVRTNPDRNGTAKVVWVVSTPAKMQAQAVALGKRLAKAIPQPAPAK